MEEHFWLFRLPEIAVGPQSIAWLKDLTAYTIEIELFDICQNPPPDFASRLYAGGWLEKEVTERRLKSWHIKYEIIHVVRNTHIQK